MLGTGEVGEIRSFRDLVVWQKSVDLAETVYGLTGLMPKDERFRLTDQMLRAATSVPANLAEGHMRGTRRDYARFVDMSRGSLAELETHLLIARRVGLLEPNRLGRAEVLIGEIGRMLTSLRNRLATPRTKNVTNNLTPKT